MLIVGNSENMGAISKEKSLIILLSIYLGILVQIIFFFINICANTLPPILTYIFYARSHHRHLIASSTMFL